MTRKYAAFVAHKCNWEAIPVMGFYKNYYRGKLTWEKFRNAYRAARRTK